MTGLHEAGWLESTVGRSVDGTWAFGVVGEDSHVLVDEGLND
jgi:hypothetical protein